MEYRYSAKEWRIGEPKSKSGYRTIPLTEEAVAILKKQKEKNKRISEISTEWEEFVFLCRKEKRNGLGSGSTYGNVMAH